MDNSAMSPADFVALTNNDGIGGGNSLIMILLFILIFGYNGFGGFGGFGGQNGGYATNEAVQQGFDNQNSLANQRELLAATNQTFHDTMGVINNAYGELQRDIAGLAVGQANLLAKQNECCASISSDIAQSRYDAAMQTAQLSQQIDARFNQLELANAQRENQELRQRIGALENGLQTKQLQSDIAAATAGVMRYPDSWTYNAGPSPFCSCNCGGYNI